MAIETTNYKLKKPLQTEYYDVDVFNENMDTIDKTINEHINDGDNPHKVTKAQVGLGNVDNTSDANKPISEAAQEALDDKLSKSEGGTVKGEVEFEKNVRVDNTHILGRAADQMADIDLGMAGSMCLGLRDGDNIVDEWRNFIELSADGGINTKASDGMHIYISDDLGVISDGSNIFAAGYVGNSGSATTAPTRAYEDVENISFGNQVVNWDTFKQYFRYGSPLKLFAGGDMYLVGGNSIGVNAGSGHSIIVNDNGTIQRHILNSNSDYDEYIEEIGVGSYAYRSYTNGEYLISALEHLHLVPGNTGGNDKKSSDGFHYVYTSNLKGEGNGPNGLSKPIISNYAEIRAQNFVENGINLSNKYARINTTLPLGVCSSEGSSTKKKITIPGFKPTNNCYFWVVFTEDNTSECPMLYINDDFSFDIYDYECYGNPFNSGFKEDIKANVLYLAYLDDADSGTYYLIDVIESFKSTGVAKKLETGRYINGVAFDGTRDINNFVVATKVSTIEDSDSSIDVNISGGFSLKNGACIKIYFDNVSELSNADPVYLNVNSTGAKPIYYENKHIDLNYFTNFHIYDFVYVDEKWVVVD